MGELDMKSRGEGGETRAVRLQPWVKSTRNRRVQPHKEERPGFLFLVLPNIYYGVPEFSGEKSIYLLKKVSNQTLLHLLRVLVQLLKSKANKTNQTNQPAMTNCFPFDSGDIKNPYWQRQPSRACLREPETPPQVSKRD